MGLWNSVKKETGRALTSDYLKYTMPLIWLGHAWLGSSAKGDSAAKPYAEGYQQGLQSIGAPKPVKFPTVAAGPEQAKHPETARRDRQRQMQMAASLTNEGGTSTFTSPLGVPGSAPGQRKTLLGL